MKKRKLVLLLSLLAFLTYKSTAQDSISPSEMQKCWHKELANRLLSAQVTAENTGNKPTGIKQRVIAQRRRGNLAGSDTTVYKYSGTMGSYYNFNDIDLLYSTNFEGFDNVNIGNPVNDVLADSIIKSIQVGYNIYSVAHVRQDRRLDFFYDYVGIGNQFNSRHSDFFSDAQGRTYQNVRLYRNELSPVFDTASLSYYTYDGASNKLISDSTVSFIMATSYLTRTYHYDAQNRVDSIYQFHLPFSIETITHFEYSGSGQLTKMVTEMYQNNEMFHRIADIYNYDGNSSIYKFHQHRQTNYIQGNISSDDSFRILRFISNGLIDSTNHQAYESGNWQTSHTYKYYYNEYNNPDSIIGKAPILPIDDNHFFYYELYDDVPVVSVEMVKMNDNLKLYPNPFSDKLNINWIGKEKSRMKVRLLNILGQEVYSAEREFLNGLNTLNLPGLVAGNYILLIQDMQGNRLERSLIKQ